MWKMFQHRYMQKIYLSMYPADQILMSYDPSLKGKKQAGRSLLLPDEPPMPYR